ncbi:hypothetical protein CYFUS_001399 [Cystobacter fuscus]|uniref:Quercetin 2,3-dioxygenase n=1 Tax=Cystobacter fuscus TaxID=43 RepID=A0A250IW63_9BACT|nr:pirin family protein [Cystobacter fuscus]ATB35985.1 hypothetical protein CYFUS_001399 [Cystobacter fuscus]
MSAIAVSLPPESRRVTLRRAQDRGHANFGWLDARFSFSFASYQDPAHENFGPLRALNEDVILPGTGFGPHGHSDMEIVLYPLSGVIEHRDSLGTHALVRPGDVQRMSAGHGITHSQMNASQSKLDHHLQIWLLPSVSGLPPSVEQAHFDDAAKHNRFCLIASPDRQDGSVKLHQDARISAAIMEPGIRLSRQLAAGRGGYLHVARGRLEARPEGEQPLLLRAGDALKLVETPSVELVAEEETEVLFFDLPLSPQL